MNKVRLLKWRFRKNAKIISHVLRCIESGYVDKRELLSISDDKYRHNVSTVVCKLTREGFITSNGSRFICLTDNGRLLLLCYMLDINPSQLVILALLYNNYYKSMKNYARWIVPLMRRELINLLPFYNKDYLSRQIKLLHNANLCAYAYNNDKDCIILTDKAYNMLYKFHDDIIALCEHIMQISYSGEPYAC